MRYRTTTLMTLAAFGLLACGKEQPRDVALDGTRPGDSITPIVDAPRPDSANLVAPKETVFVDRKPAPKPAPKVVNPNPPAPAPPAALPVPAPAPATRTTSLASGTTIAATMMDSVHSHVTKVGDQVHVKVANDVTDANGRTVIPSGSVVTLQILEIGEAANRGEKGILTLAATNVDIGGMSYPVKATATDYTFEMKARPIGAGEVAKTGAGAAAGAIIGRVIGGKTGTIIGAVGGGAAGAAVAAKSANRDIIVHAGSAVTLTLNDEFVRKP
jgi:hypothetical protein